MDKIFKNIALGALSLMLVTSCSNSGSVTEANQEEVVPVEEKEWNEISPKDVKNAVELFSDDWMALAVGHEGDMNAMTIAWGGMGELWKKPVVTVYVSKDRYTHEFMERNDYFTVTAFPQEKRDALKYIGTHSGRDGDKLKAAGITPEFTELGNPIFKEATLAIECRIIYKAPFNIDSIASDIAPIYDNMGVHTMYIGEIVNVWEK